jgi:hypothetical protein
MEKAVDAESELILNNLERLAKFSIDLEHDKFIPILQELDEVCTLAYHFGPDDGISDEDFHENIVKNHSKLQKLLKK